MLFFIECKGVDALMRFAHIPVLIGAKRHITFLAPLKGELARAERATEGSGTDASVL